MFFFLGSEAHTRSSRDKNRRATKSHRYWRLLLYKPKCIFSQHQVCSPGHLQLLPPNNFSASMILCQRTSEFTPENYYGLLEEMKAHLHKHQGAVSLVFFVGRLRIWTNIGSTRDSWQYTWYHLQIRLLYLPYYGILAHFSKWFCS